MNINPLYKEILPGPRGGKYLNEEAESKEDKETWARLRCENVGRARKGFKDWSCRLCGGATENLEDIFSCNEIMKLQKQRVAEYISNWKGEKLENELRWPVIGMLRRPVIKELRNK
ncbi:hypothetical protein KQX54_005965 [Cotesia glomerata]|uniref:Uncharacterized protein n=1 Tax=Cotesia glomerata TaxID=32391 RepID=A0AAV7HWD0_COTGL|nr:hypothetical protein KQX54_005965 [Cotesia glomerata]